jgi:hypothetical protein
VLFHLEKEKLILYHRTLGRSSGGDTMLKMTSEPLSRRHFIKVVGKGMLALSLASPFLFACTPQDAGKMVEALAELATLINNYRAQNGLQAIPLSSCMTAVATAHVMDLNQYHPEKNCSDNTHSWSTSGKWKGGCYDPNNSATYLIMWDKPKEIANYASKGESVCYTPGTGYEIAMWGSGAVTAQNALNTWQGSPLHNDVILNKGMWSCAKWRALGAAMSGNYAVAWFGEDSN